MNQLERKFGKYAIKNLTLVLIMCYIVGYIIQLVSRFGGGNSNFLMFLTLDPSRILHGQIWRLFTWLIVPPDTFGIFTLIMLYFYYSIGNLMERTLGTFRYNVYLIGGMLFTVIGSFVGLGLMYLFPDLIPGLSPDLASFVGSLYYSTYYINISIFLAFAVCYPDMQVLLMFVVPVKVKWMGILDLVLLVYEFLGGNLFTKIAVGASLLNFLLFYLQTKNLSHLKPKEVKRRNEFKQQMRPPHGITKHKCAICGQTEESNQNLEFRFCSKCNGNYEYCSEHLFTHEHVK